MSNEKLIKALGVTAEAMGQQLSPAGLLLMADDLISYGVDSVLQALVLVRKECQKLNVKNVIDRIQTSDIRPGSDEAWATAILAMDEMETVVWTDEAAQAFNVARPLLERNDAIGARMAFRDAYERLCKKAQIENIKPNWHASLGWDAENRKKVLESAEKQGRLSNSYVSSFLCGPVSFSEDLQKLIPLVCIDMKKTYEENTSDREKAKEHLEKMKALIK